MSASIERLEEERLGAFDAVTYLRRLMGFAREHRWLLGVCVVGSLATTVFQIGMPLLVRVAIDRYMDPTHGGGLAVDERVRAIWGLAGLYGLLLLANLGLSYLVGVGLNRLGQRVVMAVRVAVWSHLHRLPIRYFDTNPVGRLVTRVANDTTSIAELFTSVLASGVGDVMMFVGIVIVVGGLDLRLSAVVLTLFLPLAVLLAWFKATSRRLQRRIRELVARLNAFFQENVQGIAIVKSFTAEARMLERFHRLNEETYGVEMENVRVFAIFRPLVSACSTLAVALVLAWGGAWVLDGRLSVGTLVAFLFYVRMLFAPIDTMAEKFNILQQALVASERLLRILDTPVEGADVGAPSSDVSPAALAARPVGSVPSPIPSRSSADGQGEHPIRERGPETPEIPSRAQGRVTFENVSFAYDPDKPVLSDVSFEIAPGETVALVGPSGSGKTTIAQLLLGFYPLAGHGQGRILLDGIAIDTWDVRSLRRQFALVAQDLFLFSTTLKGNITLFSDVPDDRLRQALEASQAARIVEKFDDGLDHLLNERGTTLSQGERQLLSFARALVVDPPVLILDEATASVDSMTEALIQEALRHVLEGRSALVVAHRLSTVQEADRILVLNKGRIVEQGRHAELLEANGLYAHMFRTQKLDPR